MKIIIAGRTGTMKDSLKDKLTRMGLIPSKSFTTRPKRSPNEDSYYFLTEEEAGSFPREKKILYTVLDRHERFMTEETVKEADIFVVDYNGVKDLTALLPDEAFLLVYCEADYGTALIAASKRGEYGDVEYMNRYNDENDQFSELERNLGFHLFQQHNGQCRIARGRQKSGLPANIFAIIKCYMNFDDESLEYAVDAVWHIYSAHRGIRRQIRKAIRRNALPVAGNYMQMPNGEVLHHDLAAAQMYWDRNQLVDLMYSSWYAKEKEISETKEKTACQISEKRRPER